MDVPSASSSYSSSSCSSFGLKQGDSHDRIPIKRVEILAAVLPFSASVEVSQTYINSTDTEIGNLHYDFAPQLLDKITKLELISNSAVCCASIEVIPSNENKSTLGALSIFPLSAHSELTVKFTYVIPIAINLSGEKKASLLFTLPSYLADQLVDLAVALNCTDAKAYGLHVLSISYQNKLSFQTILVCSPTEPVAIASSSHPQIEIAKRLSSKGNTCASNSVVTLREESGRLGADLLLEIILASYAASLWFERVGDSQQKLFALSLQPNLLFTSRASSSGGGEERGETRSEDSPSRDSEVVILLDRSASMTVHMSIAIQLCKKIIDLLPEDLSFRIFGFGSTTVEVLPAHLEGEATSSSRKSSYCLSLDDIRPDLLSSDLLQALNAVLGLDNTTKKTVRLLLISDGDLSNFSQCAAFLRTHANFVRMCAIGVSGPSSILSALTAACNGSVCYLEQNSATRGETSTCSSADVSSAAQAQVLSLLAPCLSHLSLQWKNGTITSGNQFVPGISPTILADEPYQFFSFILNPAPDGFVTLSGNGISVSLPFASAVPVPVVHSPLSRSSGEPSSSTSLLLHSLAGRVLLKQLNDCTDQTRPAVIALSKRFSIPVLSHTTFAIAHPSDPNRKNFLDLGKNPFVNSINIRTRKVEDLKIEIDRLQRLLSDTSSSATTLADCNIRLEKALEEYQKTPEHAMELSFIRNARRVKHERENLAALERLRSSGAYPAPGNVATSSSGVVIGSPSTATISPRPGSGGGVGDAISGIQRSGSGSGIHTSRSSTNMSRFRDETCPIRLLSLTADQISALPSASWTLISKFCVRGLSDDEIRAIRAILPPFKPYQRSQLDFLDSLDFAIEQIQKKPTAPIRPSSSSPLLLPSSSKGAADDDGKAASQITRVSRGSAILAKKFKGPSNPGAILNELNKKVAPRKAQLAHAPNISAPQIRNADIPHPALSVASNANSNSDGDGVITASPGTSLSSANEGKEEAAIGVKAPPISTSKISSSSNPLVAKITVQLKRSFEALARSLAQIQPNDKEITSHTRTTAVAIKELAQQQRIAGDNLAADKTDALAGNLVAGVKAVLVARTTPGTSQEQLLAAKNGFVPIAVACRDLWSI